MPITTLDARTALVVLDLQNMVMNVAAQPHTVADVLDRNVRLAEAFRAKQLPVVLVRTTGVPPGRTDQSGTAASARTYPDGWDILRRELTSGPHDVVTKQAWGAFGSGTGLHESLRKLEVTQVVLTGIATSIAVESTARAAHEHGYHVTLVTDAMTDRDAALHEHSTTRIFPRLGETGTTAELLAVLG